MNKELSYTSKQTHMHIQSDFIYSRVWPDQDFWSQCHIWNPTEQIQSLLLNDGMSHFLLGDNNISILRAMKRNAQLSSYYLIWDFYVLSHP